MEKVSRWPSGIFSRWKRHSFSILVWLGAVSLVIWMFTQRARQYEYVGIAKADTVQILAQREGWLKNVPVRLFQKVNAGQVVAVISTLEDNLLRAQINTINAEIERLQAEFRQENGILESDMANRQFRWEDSHRAFVKDVVQTRLGILELKTELETDRILLNDLKLELENNKSLLQQEAVAPYELQKSQMAYDSLAKKIEQNELRLEQMNLELNAAQKQADEFAKTKPAMPPDLSMEQLLKSIKVQEGLIAELTVQRQETELKSPIDGVVIQINFNQPAAGNTITWMDKVTLAKTGEFVSPGDPILTISPVKPDEVIAYMPSNLPSDLVEGEMVELIKTTPPYQIATAKIESIGPALDILPTQLWVNPAMPQWGRPFVIKIPPQFDIVAGEMVNIRAL